MSDSPNVTRAFIAPAGRCPGQWRPMQIVIMAGALALTACSGDYHGKQCQGTVRDLSGQPLGTTQAQINDKYTSFTVTQSEQALDSGTLYSRDRTRYFPSAVTQEGYLAQRLSDTRFSIINAQKNQWISYACP